MGSAPRESYRLRLHNRTVPHISIINYLYIPTVCICNRYQYYFRFFIMRNSHCNIVCDIQSHNKCIMRMRAPITIKYIRERGKMKVDARGITYFYLINHKRNKITFLHHPDRTRSAYFVVTCFPIDRTQFTRTSSAANHKI